MQFPIISNYDNIKNKNYTLKRKKDRGGSKNVNKNERKKEKYIYRIT